MTGETLSVTLKMGESSRRHVTVSLPEADVPDWRQSLSTATKPHRRRLTRGFISAYAGDAKISWVWLSPMRLFDLLTVEAQDELANELLTALQSVAEQRKPNRRRRWS